MQAPTPNALPPGALHAPSWLWAPFQPDGALPWGLGLAGHLYGRAGFGANWGELQQAVAGGPEAAVEKLLHPEADVAAFNESYSAYEKAAAGSESDLAAWWLRRLLETPHPLLEQMTLFWHNHFAITNGRVANPALMCRYVAVLRRHALGRFDALLEAVLDEPAVLLSLGGQANRKARPNLDFSRAVLERFTLGPGVCADGDVRAAAGALTGWFVSHNEAQYIPREHDSGPKKLLGREGDFGRKDLVRVLLEHPATAQFIVRRLCRWFISDVSALPESVIAPLAADLRKDYDLARLARTILLSNLFFSSRGQKVKSPVQFAVGLVRPLEGKIGTVRLASDLTALGQDLLQPPTAEGWAGGQSWINRFTLLGRARLAQDLLAASGPYEGKTDPAAAASKHGQSGLQAASRFLCDLLFQGNLPEETSQAVLKRAGEAPAPPPGEGALSAPLRRLALLLATMPEYQMA